MGDGDGYEMTPAELLASKWQWQGECLVQSALEQGQRHAQKQRAIEATSRTTRAHGRPSPELS